MDHFLDAILRRAEHSRRRDDLQSLAISHPVVRLIDCEHQCMPGDYPLWCVKCRVGCSGRLQGGFVLI